VARQAYTIQAASAKTSVVAAWGYEWARAIARQCLERRSVLQQTCYVPRSQRRSEFSTSCNRMGVSIAWLLRPLVRTIPFLTSCNIIGCFNVVVAPTVGPYHTVTNLRLLPEATFRRCVTFPHSCLHFLETPRLRTSLTAVLITPSSFTFVPTTLASLSFTSSSISHLGFPNHSILNTHCDHQREGLVQTLLHGVPLGALDKETKADTL